MNIHDATREYETWLRTQCPILESDLDKKHARMAKDPFVFLRATFYRWIEQWPEFCPELNDAPRLLAIGDTHVENFGTWRDAEGRLIWGANDFDEAFLLPYTSDLVRLAASAVLSLRSCEITTSLRDTCEAILHGYTQCLELGGRPYVVGGAHTCRLPRIDDKFRDPEKFWRKLTSWPLVDHDIPHAAEALLTSMLPATSDIHIHQRVAGLGSLGKPRFVGIAQWQGGPIAREVKPLTLSAAARGGDGAGKSYYNAILGKAVRCPDPLLRAESSWIIRRLAPDCDKLDLTEFAGCGELPQVFSAMGWEVGNVHLGGGEVVQIVRRDLASRPERWLRDAAKRMVEAVERDWRAWRETT